MPTKKIIQKQKKTEQRPIVDFRTSVLRFWKRYFDVKGIAQRSEYWFSFLFVWLVFLLLFGLMSEQGVISNIAAVVFWFWVLVIFIPRLTVAARRLHDSGFSAWWLLIMQPLGIFVMSNFLPWLWLSFSNDRLYTGDIIAIGFLSLFFGYELPLFIIGFLKPRLKNNKYRK